jgi:hypothetical protein
MTDPELNELAEMSVLHLIPGDVLILSVQGKLSAAKRKRVGDFITEHFPQHQLLVLEDGTKLSAMRKGRDFCFPTGEKGK